MPTNPPLTLVRARKLNLMEVLKKPISEMLKLSDAAKMLLHKHGIAMDNQMYCLLLLDVDKIGRGSGRGRCLDGIEEQLNTLGLTFHEKPTEELLAELRGEKPVPSPEPARRPEMEAELLANTRRLREERQIAQHRLDELDTLLSRIGELVDELSTKVTVALTMIGVDPRNTELPPELKAMLEPVKTHRERLSVIIADLDGKIHAFKTVYRELSGEDMPDE